MNTTTAEGTPNTAPVTPEQAEERVRTVLGWLLDGQPSVAAVELAQTEWKVGHRMAQIYVQRAKQLLAEDAEEEELRYYRRLSQQQRDRLIFVLFRALKTVDQMQPDILRSLASIVTAGTKLLESRDRLVLGEAKEAERERKRKETAEVSRIIAETEAAIKKGKELIKRGPPPVKVPRKFVPRPRPPLVRKLEPGEPVFNDKNPLDVRKMTPRQLAEWKECLDEFGDARKFPWYQDGATKATLFEEGKENDPAAIEQMKQAMDNAFNRELMEQLLRQPPNPASQIAIVSPPSTKGKSR